MCSEDIELTDLVIQMYKVEDVGMFCQLVKIADDDGILNIFRSVRSTNNNNLVSKHQYLRHLQIRKGR